LTQWGGKDQFFDHNLEFLRKFPTKKIPYQKKMRHSNLKNGSMRKFVVIYGDMD
jgi:hypothetical protein